MNHKFWPVTAGLILLTACGEENQKPNLDISGQWHVNHSFDEQCEVNAGFSESLMILSFYSLVPGACQPELYGVVNNALPIQIDSKSDFFAEDGSLSTTLAVSAPEYGGAGVLALQATSQGLMASITSATDPNDALQPLLQQNYSLTRVSAEKLDFLLGVWGAPCEELNVDATPGEFCEFLEFTESGYGRMRLFRGASIDPDGYAPVSWDQWEIFNYALRHFEHEKGEVVLLDLIIISSGRSSLQEQLRLSVTENGMIMTFFEGEEPAGMLYRVK